MKHTCERSTRIVNKAINHAFTTIILFSEWQIGSSFYAIDCESQCVTVKANKMCLACQWGSLVDESIESASFRIVDLRVDFVCKQPYSTAFSVELWNIKHSNSCNFKNYLILFYKITLYVLSFVHLPFCFLFKIFYPSLLYQYYLPLTGVMDSWIAGL